MISYPWLSACTAHATTRLPAPRNSASSSTSTSRFAGGTSSDSISTRIPFTFGSFASSRSASPKASSEVTVAGSGRLPPNSRAARLRLR
jgi:hypothetical protein